MVPAGPSVKNGQQQGGTVDHIAVAPKHTVGCVVLLKNMHFVAVIKERVVPQLLSTRPFIRLGGARGPLPQESRPASPLSASERPGQNKCRSPGPCRRKNDGTRLHKFPPDAAQAPAFRARQRTSVSLAPQGSLPGLCPVKQQVISRSSIFALRFAQCPTGAIFAFPIVNLKRGLVKTRIGCYNHAVFRAGCESLPAVNLAADTGRSSKSASRKA